MSGGDISRGSDGNYVVTVSRPGKATITVSGGGLTANKEFRVKPIPDPKPITTLGKDGGTMTAAEAQNTTGLIAKLENFDFDAKCSIQSYVLLHVPKREDMRQANVSGPMNADGSRLLSSAKPGDLYQFQSIKARCPGDVAARPIGSMSFVIR
jgi:hypothetical protein